jgi:hypothetical protein
MTKAEMILKVVMAPIDPARAFADQFAKLLPEADPSEFQKVLDMKVGQLYELILCHCPTRTASECCNAEIIVSCLLFFGGVLLY